MKRSDPRPMLAFSLSPVVWAALLSVVALGLGGCAPPAGHEGAAEGAQGVQGGQGVVAASAPLSSALSVALVSPSQQVWPRTVTASGNVQPWQEASIGAEVSGMRLTAVLVNVGDVVRKGQLLAQLNDESTRLEVAQQQAAVAEAQATLAQAQLSAQRSQALDGAGAISQQDRVQYDTAAATAAAKLASAQALLATQALKLRNTQVLAPDDGVISARTATVGAAVASGGELFKLLRQGRLEWRAELRVEQLAGLRIGQPVALVDAAGQAVAGQVRQIAPTVDTASRNAIVYVDLPAQHGLLRAGALATGELQLGSEPVLALPQRAVLQRDGHAYVMKLLPDHRVRQTKLTLGRQQGGAVQVLAGLTPQDRVVADGAAFLSDGDHVTVIASPAHVPASPVAAPSAAATTAKVQP